jgi:hypothetical protein
VFELEPEITDMSTDSDILKRRSQIEVFLKMSFALFCSWLYLKPKAVPLHAMKTLGGQMRYSSYSFSTS